MNKKILIIEDDADISRLIALQLEDLHCQSQQIADGKAGLDRFKKEDFDLIILDLGLPTMDGLTVCREIRATAHKSYIPILMLTAKTTELDRVVGLEMGADDYLTKPFSLPEFSARVKALFRRVEAMSKQPLPNHTIETIEIGDFKLNTALHEVSFKDKPLNLTVREFDLLEHFMTHPNRVYSRLQLLDKVWGYQHEGYEHTVNTHINRLRAKIEVDPKKPEIIQTVWGVGYKGSFKS